MEILIKAARETNCIITVENHSIIGGMGGAVSEILSENYPTLIKRIGINDTFGESGSLNDLFYKYGLTAENIAEEVKKYWEKIQKYSG